MSFERGVQIDVGNDLSVDDNKRVAVEQRARIVDRAAGAENFRLFNVMQFDAKATAIARARRTDSGR